MRNAYGAQWGPENLTLAAHRDPDFAIDPKLSENVSFGFDYRSQFLYDRASKSSAFQSMTASLYGAVSLSSKISFYFKQDLVNGSYNGVYAGLFNGTELYSVMKILPNNGYIKGGSFLPDYGWRIDDHTAYTRGGDIGFTGAGYHQGLLFIPNYHDIGVEVGGYLGGLMITAGIFNGTGQFQPIDFSKEKAYSAKLEYMGSLSGMNYRIGASGYGYKSFKMGGIMAGLAGCDSNLVLFGEIDWTRNSFAYIYNPAANAYSVGVFDGMHAMTSFAELDFRLIQGLWAIGRFDIIDPLQGITDDEHGASTNTIKRVSLGFEFFPYQFVEVRPQYRIILENPGISNDVALVQMHVWF